MGLIILILNWLICVVLAYNTSRYYIKMAYFTISLILAFGYAFSLTKEASNLEVYLTTVFSVSTIIPLWVIVVKKEWEEIEERYK